MSAVGGGKLEGGCWTPLRSQRGVVDSVGSSGVVVSAVPFSQF